MCTRGSGLIVAAEGTIGGAGGGAAGSGAAGAALAAAEGTAHGTVGLELRAGKRD